MSVFGVGKKRNARSVERAAGTVTIRSYTIEDWLHDCFGIRKTKSRKTGSTHPPTTATVEHKKVHGV